MRAPPPPPTGGQHPPRQRSKRQRDLASRVGPLTVRGNRFNKGGTVMAHSIGRRLMGMTAASAALAVVIAAFVSTPALAQQQPIKIGFSMALTGPLGAGGKSALIAMEIWRDDVNAKGGLLGRKVELVYYDDQTAPAKVPPLYTKLIDVDKVDLVVSSYGTNVTAPAMNIVRRKKMVFPSLFGLA